jgi:hypothetical protein
MISRRSFFTLACSALAAPSIILGKEEVPSLLDHVLLGCNDLPGGIDFVERRIGVRAAFGGVHPGRGTQNALLSFGERRYLEIIAPDPAQKGSVRNDQFLKLAEPRLVGWAAHPGDIDQFASSLRKSGVAFHPPQPGSRQRPDGRMLNWKSLSLEDDHGGLLPFFIEWGASSLHPSADAPKGCTLVRFAATSPDPGELSRLSTLLGLDLSITKGEKPQLHATFSGPRGEFSVTS